MVVFMRVRVRFVRFFVFDHNLLCAPFFHCSWIFIDPLSMFVIVLHFASHYTINSKWFFVCTLYTYYIRVCNVLLYIVVCLSAFFHWLFSTFSHLGTVTFLLIHSLIRMPPSPLKPPPLPFLFCTIVENAFLRFYLSLTTDYSLLTILCAISWTENCNNSW